MCIQARQRQKDLPKDDEEIERKEQVDIDKGFVESSSEEDELTDKGERKFDSCSHFEVGF